MLLARSGISTVYRSFNADGDDTPPAIKYSMYLGPTGACLLALAIFSAAGTDACLQGCIHKAEKYEQKFLRCQEDCEHGYDGRNACMSKCSHRVGFTLRKSRRTRQSCEKSCGFSNRLTRCFAGLGALATLTVVPLLGSYRNSCRCECCLGEGCSSRLVLLILSWFCYGAGGLWLFPCVLEAPGDIGGKVVFMLAHGLAVAAMWSSRSVAERGALEVARSIQQDQKLSVLVGAPKMLSEPTKADLQQQIDDLQQQVCEILQLQKARVVAVQADAAQAPQVSTLPDLL